MLDHLNHLNELDSRAFANNFNAELEELATLKFTKVEETRHDLTTRAEHTLEG